MSQTGLPALLRSILGHSSRTQAQPHRPNLSYQSSWSPTSFPSWTEVAPVPGVRATAKSESGPLTEAKAGVGEGRAEAASPSSQGRTPIKQKAGTTLQGADPPLPKDVPRTLSQLPLSSLPCTNIHSAPSLCQIPTVHSTLTHPDPSLPMLFWELGWYLQCRTLLLKGQGRTRLLAAHRAGRIGRGGSLAVLGLHWPAVSGQVFPLLGYLLLREAVGRQGLGWVSSHSPVVQLRSLDWCGGLMRGTPTVQGPGPLHSWPHCPIKPHAQGCFSLGREAPAARGFAFSSGFQDAGPFESRGARG